MMVGTALSRPLLTTTLRPADADNVWKETKEFLDNAGEGLRADRERSLLSQISPIEHTEKPEFGWHAGQVDDRVLRVIAQLRRTTKE
jgi:hypothetical protein